MENHTTEKRMSIAAAVKTKQKYFNRIKPCRDCGGHAHWMAKWTENECWCAECYPETESPMSLGQLMMGSKGRIAAQEKMLRKNWTPGRAFSGHSTI